MNQDQEARLEKIFRDNHNRGIAIAIIGCWGIGKTFAWNKFIREGAGLEKDRRYLPLNIRLKYPNIFNKKYSYVSLFGIESLADLKVAISTNMSRNYFNKESTQFFETPKFLKKSLSALRDVKFSGSGEGFGISSSAKIFEAVLYSQVKDAIICFDDFERMSKKLEIQDVMGLANQLKSERSCQVILILDESKTDGESKNKYAEYKEKLIDETIKITSVEPLIRKNTKGIDEPLVDLMVKFADELEIHNFRFFQKVIKLYKKFTVQLSDDVAYSTKEIILIRVLQGYFIEDFGIEKDLKWIDFSTDNALILMDHPEENELESIKIQTLRKLNGISYKFVHDADQWLIEFKRWFDQKGEPDFSKLNELANSDLISDKSNNTKEILENLMTQWRNLQVSLNYCEELYKASQESISFNNLENLYFHCFLLKKFGRNDLSKQLKLEILNYLVDKLPTNYEEIWDNATHFGFKKNNLFHWYIKRWKSQNPSVGLPSLFDVLKVYILDRSIKNKASLVLKNAVQNDWENFIFSGSSVDEELKKIHKGEIMTRILQQNIDVTLTPLIKQNIEAILVNKLNFSNDPANKKNIEFVIENFKKEGLL